MTKIFLVCEHALVKLYDLNLVVSLTLEMFAAKLIL